MQREPGCLASAQLHRQSKRPSVSLRLAFRSFRSRCRNALSLACALPSLSLTLALHIATSVVVHSKRRKHTKPNSQRRRYHAEHTDRNQPSKDPEPGTDHSTAPVAPTWTHFDWRGTPAMCQNPMESRRSPAPDEVRPQPSACAFASRRQRI